MNILNMKPDEMGIQLDMLNEEDLIKIYTMTINQNNLSREEKNKALKKMDTGIYDENGKLIGDKLEEEDKYEWI